MCANLADIDVRREEVVPLAADLGAALGALLNHRRSAAHVDVERVAVRAAVPGAIVVVTRHIISRRVDTRGSRTCARVA